MIDKYSMKCLNFKRRSATNKIKKAINMHKLDSTGLVKLLGGAVLSLSALSTPTLANELPKRPILDRDVHLQEQGKHTRPAIPALRVSNDGRIAVDFSSVKQVEFTLIKPEALNTAFDRSENGYGILGGDIAPFDVDRRLFDSSTKTRFGSASHHTICDSTPIDIATAGTDRNPYSCPADPSADCYDLTMIATNMGGGVELWGTPFTVKVKSPKTKDAYIESVEVGTPVKGPTIPVGSFFEPLTTADGKLLIGRNGFGSMFYSVAPESSAGCDVTQWTTIHEITHAYHDPQMRKANGDARYGIAAYPMKDANGSLIPDGALSKITYPWMDKDGNNIVFTSVDATLFYSNGSGLLQERYPAECYVSNTGCIENPTDRQITNVDTTPILRGIGVFGSWTHGKMLQIDNLVNNIDFGTGWGDNQHYKVTLYNEAGEDAKVRIGGAGNIFSPYPAPGHLPQATTGDFTYIIDSLENIFNDIDAMKPSTIRDTVWYLNISKVTDKLVFDEYLNPHVLINAEWIPTLVHTDTSVPSANRPNNAMHYRDGFTSGSRTTSGSGFGEAVWFQNAATGVDWQVPAHGLAYAPDPNKPVRAEPVASGGVDGRGLWLFEDNNVSFAIPANSDKTFSNYNWYVGLFVDPYDTSSTQRKLLTFPDGSSVRLVGRNQVELVPNGTDTAAVSFDLNNAGQSRKWSHLGFKISNDGADVEFLLNGFKKGQWSAGSSATRLLRVQQGNLLIGKPQGSTIKGFHGWTDSLKVIAQDVGIELACNYANGTIVGLGANYTGDLTSQAAAYPASSHTAVTGFLNFYGKPAFSNYACLHDYTTDLDIDTRFVPDNTVAIREDLIFPEGPLLVNSARPDTTANKFCLSCHVAGSIDHKLDVSALTYSGTAVENDLRRQPGQGPRLVFGNLPANHFGILLPSTDQVSNSSGSITDLYTIGCGSASGDCTSASSDLDGDGLFDLVDADIDGDGVLNINDAWPNDASKSADLDKDRVEDSLDSDRDGDGVPNSTDAFPDNAKETLDSDGDGFGDNIDVDANNDGIMDVIAETFPQNQARKVYSNQLNGQWQEVDPSQPGRIYGGMYVLKYDQGGDGETGLKHELLQHSFDATLKFEYVDAHVGQTVFAWQFEDASSEMQVELHVNGTHPTAGTLVAAIKNQGDTNFSSFGSVGVPAVSTAAHGNNTKYEIAVSWRQTSGANGTWQVQYATNGAALTTLGSTSVTSSSTDTTRWMKITDSGFGREEIGITEVSLTPFTGTTPPATAVTLKNSSFESTGSAVFGPLLAATDWVFSGASSTVGVMTTPSSFGFPNPADGNNALYIGVDYVSSNSTSGKAYQDLGQTEVGTEYTITAVVNPEANWPSGYKLSLRDATTDAELASTSADGNVSISYTETVQRSLRLQIETNGSVSQGTALRTSIDNIQLSTVKPLAIKNASFEQTGAPLFGPLLSATDWVISGDASTIGVTTNPASLGFGSANDGNNALYVGVDHVSGSSTSGKAYQDLGQTQAGKSYSLTAVVATESAWPAGYKLSLRDASNDQELAASTSTGNISINYTESQVRTLRVQIETNGSVTGGTALRATIDNLQLTTN